MRRRGRYTREGVIKNLQLRATEQVRAKMGDYASRDEPKPKFEAYLGASPTRRATSAATGADQCPGRLYGAKVNAAA
jgi:hypothetical protein